jgi:hypothetical protein
LTKELHLPPPDSAKNEINKKAVIDRSKEEI